MARERALTELALVVLQDGDVDEILALGEANREHIAKFGGYGEHGEAIGREWAASMVRNPDPRTASMGLRLHGELIGLVVWTEVEPTVFALGYWLARDHVGRGYMTTAVRATMDLLQERGATAFLSSANRRNHRSLAVLDRLGFDRRPAKAEMQTFRRDVGETT